ncbi:hypothetical protein JEZ13_10905 [bacterium]|nr:hypothetical protein [bacterium]
MEKRFIIFYRKPHLQKNLLKQRQDIPINTSPEKALMVAVNDGEIITVERLIGKP